MGNRKKIDNGQNASCLIYGKKIKRHEGRQRNSRIFFWGGLAIVLLVLSMTSVVLFKTNKDKVAAVADVSSAKVNEIINQEEYVQANLKFFSEHFLPIINGIADLNKIPPPLRNRYCTIGAVLNREYGGTFNLTFGRIHSCSRFGRHTLAKSIFKDGRPYIEIFIPTLREFYEHLRKTGDEKWYEQFRVYLFIAVLHELEHFAAHHFETKNNPDIELEEEIDVWAKMAEYAFLPVREYDPSLLTAGDTIVLNKWIESGRNKDSDLWRNFFKDNIGFGR